MAAAKAAVAAFRESALLPVEENGWNTYEGRLMRYRLADLYYHNTVYNDLASNYARLLKQQRKLYKYIRGVVNPVTRLVDSYPAKIYGGALDFDTLTRGAIPITGTDDERLRDAIRQIWRWSVMAQQKSLYVRHGALYGDSVLKVVDDRVSDKVRIEVVHPSKLKQVTFDEVGNVKGVVIEYQRTDDAPLTVGDKAEKPQAYVYTEVIDGDHFATFRDGKPHAYFVDEGGTPIYEWANEYGFVPLVVVQHKHVGLLWGENTFHDAMTKIDEANDAASVLNDAVRKMVNLPYYIAGAKSSKDITVETNRDGVPMLYGPEGSVPQPMRPELDIAAALENVRETRLELERDMPELALHRMREQTTSVSGVAVENMYKDAIDKYEEARGNYDDGLVRAHQMAISIGALRGYEGFEGFSLESYAAGDLEHYIASRPIIRDDLSKYERITALQGAKVPAWLILEELGFSQDVIDRVTEQQERDARNAARAFGQSVFGDDEGEINEDADEGEDDDDEEEEI